MLEALMRLHKFYKGFEAADICLEQTVGKPTCISGCGKCCQVNTVRSSTIEAINAVSILTGQGKLDQVLQLTEGWLLDHHKEAPTYDGMIVNKFVPPKIREEFEKLSVLPCPYLLENMQCLVHDARPLVCRAYGVTRTNNGFCPRPPGKGETLTQFQYIKSPQLRNEIENFKKKYTIEHPEWLIYGFFPTLIYRAAKEKEFRKLVQDNQIATAKIIGTQLDTTLMWQPQLEALDAGVAPDLVLTH
jgi:Fe-S-cluster containining protein